MVGGYAARVRKGVVVRASEMQKTKITLSQKEMDGHGVDH